MKILWLSNVGNLGGASLCMAEAAQALITLGNEIHVVVPSEGPLRPRLEDVGATVSLVPMAWWVHWPQYPLRVQDALRHVVRHTLSLCKLLLILRKLRPDVVVTNTVTIPIGAVAAKLTRTPHLWYVHEFGREDHGLIFDLGDSRSIALMEKLSARIIVNSLAVERKFQRYVPSNKLRRVYYSVETPHGSEAIGPSHDEFSLLLVGQLAPGKGQEEAIRALACLGDLGTDTRLQLLGGDDFNYQPYLENLARELGVLSILHFLGVQNPFPYYAAAHVVLMCSRSEAFGRVTVEAMKMGRPVVGANAGATAELICDGHTGLLYRQGDPRDLADKLVQLHDDPVRRKTLGKAAQQWACNQFNSAKYGEDLSQVLREALDASRVTQERSSFDTR